jgi:beta-mannosidase
MTDIVNLNGIWKFKIDPENIGEMYPEDVIIAYKSETRFMDISYDDSNWKEIKVPSCWQAEGYFYNGIAWYRRHFEVENINYEKIYIINFLGVDYFCDIWINGYYLGSHEGYFGKISIDITKWLKRNNILTIMVNSPNDTNLLVPKKKEKKLIKGALQDFDANDLFVNPAGIWNDVWLEKVSLQHIKDIYIESRFNQNYNEADVITNISIQNESNDFKKMSIEINIIPKNFDGKGYTNQKEIILVPGSNIIYDITHINDPILWWVWDIGKPNLYLITIILKNIKKEITSSKYVTIGLREIKQNNGWELYLNGKRIFLRGVNYLSDQLLSNMDKEKYKKDVELAQDANVNIIRAFCNVEKDYFYELCDEKGILIYQDFPLQWEMSNSSELVRNAIVQVSEMIHLLYNHPCIIIWCFGSEPGKKNFEKLGYALSEYAGKLDRSRIINQGNSWIKQWDFDEFSKKYKWAIDNHFYPGWYTDPWKDMFDINKMKFEEFDLVTEFGAQSIPCLESLEKIFKNEGIWPPNWKKYQRYCFQKEQQFNWIKQTESIEELIYFSQEYQAFLLKYIIEFLRCRKFDQCNGIMMFLFNDNCPAITWSVVDYYRKLKKGFESLKKAYEPILLTMDWPRIIKSNNYPEYNIYVINDKNVIINDCCIYLKVIEFTGALVLEKYFNINIDKSIVKTCAFQLNNLKDGDVIEIKLYRGEMMLLENQYKPIPEGDYSVEWFTKNCPIV